MTPSPTTTTSTSDQRRGSCPYAVALEDDEQASQTDTSLDHVLAQAKKSCPAFSGGDCPFAKQDVRQTLIQVPKSHYNDAVGKNYNFKQALQHLHTIGSTLNKNDGSNEFALPACPATGLMEQEQIPFAVAMEKFSLASIMSRMAAAQETGDDDHANDEEEESPTKSTVVAPTSTTTTDAASASSVSLSQAFKSGTAVAHQAAEDVHFVQNFVKGQIDRNLYADLVLSLYHVYDKMETLLQTHHKKHFSSCHFPHELNRTATLAEDVDFWHGDDSSTSKSLYISPATQDYMDRLDMLAQTKPLLLLAHAYTRYLGDLSGGKVLARVAKRALQLQDDGLAFYHFQNVKSAKAFKDQYRSCLDSLPLSSSQIGDLVQEANVAFLLNMRLFEELDVKANVPGAQVRDWQDTLAALERAVASGEKTIPDECPFAKTNGSKSAVAKSGATKGGRCPWPFVFMHDPIMGLQDYQTWIVVGLVLCWAWSAFAPTTAAVS
jgi:heme oxygenase